MRPSTILNLMKTWGCLLVVILCAQFMPHLSHPWVAIPSGIALVFTLLALRDILREHRDTDRMLVEAERKAQDDKSE